MATRCSACGSDHTAAVPLAQSTQTMRLAAHLAPPKRLSILWMFWRTVTLAGAVLWTCLFIDMILQFTAFLIGFASPGWMFIGALATVVERLDPVAQSWIAFVGDGPRAFWIIVVAFFGTLALISLAHRFAVLPQQIERWRNAWVCLACGNTWVPGEQS